MEGPQKVATILSDLTRNLAVLDRYERRALSRPDWISTTQRLPSSTGQFELISGQLNAMQRFMHAKFDAIDKRFDGMDKRFDKIEVGVLVLCARIFPALLRKQCVAFYGQAKQNPLPDLQR